MSEKPTEVTYCTVKFTVGWLPGSIGLTETAKTTLSQQLGINRRVIRGSYAILGASRDPLIQQGAALRRLLTQIRDEYTIPEFTLVSSAQSETSVRTAKVPGSYLIEAGQVEAFLARFEEVRTQYLAWGRQVADEDNYRRLREADQEALGQDWAVVSAKYPTAAQLADAVTCDFPRIESFNAAFTLADVAPQTARRLQQQAEARLAASMEGAVAELVLEFKLMVDSVARNCGRRIRLMPPTTHQLARLQYAEVQTILQHADDPENIPEGKLLVTVQPCQAKADSEKLVQHGSAEDLLLTTEEYNNLGPYETDENRQLTTSAFDNLTWMADRIQRVKGMLGNDENAKNLTQLADEISQTLAQAGTSAADITKQLKGSAVARNSLRATFQAYSAQLAVQETQIRKGRRRIDVGRFA